MLPEFKTDTIAAIATPLGQGGIGIIRISGPLSKAIGKSVFRSDKKDFQGPKPYRLHHGWIQDQNGQDLDEVLVSFMPGPGSYTGEDVFEINCHGGPAVLQTVLELLLHKGARLANAGEFTLRAFLNGRLDLTQAESVMEMIGSPTQAGLHLASSKIRGDMSETVIKLRHRLESLRAKLCAESDFPGDDEDLHLKEDISNGVQEVKGAVARLLENYQRLSCWRDGAAVALLGPVNAGKSSLLNALLGRQRAIVTQHPGTTRDYLEESLTFNGLPVRLIDTAGLRQSIDEIELAGMEQGRSIGEKSDLVCLVIDGSTGISREVLDFAQSLGQEKVLVVANKADLAWVQSDIDYYLPGFECLNVSAKTGYGLENLIARIRSRIIGHSAEPAEGELVPNLRQKEALNKAFMEMTELEKAIEQGLPSDLWDFHLEAGCRCLAEITGEICSEDILDRVFSSFCIGK